MSVSVFVLFYNMEEFVEKRLNSIFSQDQTLINQVIIIDDCSFDRTQEIVLNYLEENDVCRHFDILTYFNEINIGSPLKNFCKYFDLFRGDFIWVAEGDDFVLDEDWVSKMLKLIKDNNASLAFSRITYIDSNDFRILPKLKHIKLYNFKQKKWYADIYRAKHLLSHTLLTNLSAAMFKKSDVDIEFLQDVKDTFIQSGDICLQASVLFNKSNIVVFNGETESYFLRHEKSMTVINTISGVNKLEKKRLAFFIGSRLRLVERILWNLYSIKFFNRMNIRFFKL